MSHFLIVLLSPILEQICRLQNSKAINITSCDSAWKSPKSRAKASKPQPRKKINVRPDTCCENKLKHPGHARFRVTDEDIAAPIHHARARKLGPARAIQQLRERQRGNMYLINKAPRDPRPTFDPPKLTSRGYLVRSLSPSIALYYTRMSAARKCTVRALNAWFVSQTIKRVGTCVYTKTLGDLTLL